MSSGLLDQRESYKLQKLSPVILRQTVFFHLSDQRDLLYALSKGRICFVPLYYAYFFFDKAIVLFFRSGRFLSNTDQTYKRPCTAAYCTCQFICANELARALFARL